VTPAEQARMAQENLAGRLRGLAPLPARSEACLYTVTPDAGFVIERHPERDRVIVVSACSGHGFKHSAGIGEAVAALAAGGPVPVDLAPFRSARFGRTAGQA
jgi:sarcosine oxidase